MKVLIAHNEYGRRSGEEAVVETMAEIFNRLGMDVVRLTRSTAGVRDSFRGKVSVLLSGLWCPPGVKGMREALRRERPDMVNVHNLYPFISPAALRECRREGVPVVMTVHNFRLVCPTGLFMRGGAPCEECLRRGDEWGCLRHNCEGSLAKSAAYAARNWVARVKRHYIDCVDLFACITDFQRRKLAEAGFPEDKLTVIPNSIALPEGECEVAPAPQSGGYVGFVGRLSKEKGIDLIIEAARRNPDIKFRLAGSEDTELGELPANVELAGFLRGGELDEFYRKSRFMVMASRWYEGFPMSILEASAMGRCVVAPDHGGFTEIVSQPGGDGRIGLLFEPGNADALSRALRRLWDAPEEARRLGAAARRTVERKYSTTAVAQQWRGLAEKLTGKEIG